MPDLCAWYMRLVYYHGVFFFSGLTAWVTDSGYRPCFRGSSCLCATAPRRLVSVAVDLAPSPPIPSSIHPASPPRLRSCPPLPMMPFSPPPAPNLRVSRYCGTGLPSPRSPQSASRFPSPLPLLPPPTHLPTTGAEAGRARETEHRARLRTAGARPGLVR